MAQLNLEVGLELRETSLEQLASKPVLEHLEVVGNLKVVKVLLLKVEDRVEKDWEAEQE